MIHLSGSPEFFEACDDWDHGKSSIKFMKLDSVNVIWIEPNQTQTKVTQLSVLQMKIY